MKFECAFICPEILTVVGGPGYYPDNKSSTPPVATPNCDLKTAIYQLKNRYSVHQPLQNVQNSRIMRDAA